MPHFHIKHNGHCTGRIHHHYSHHHSHVRAPTAQETLVSMAVSSLLAGLALGTMGVTIPNPVFIVAGAVLVITGTALLILCAMPHIR